MWGGGEGTEEQKPTWQGTSGTADAHRGRHGEEASRSVPAETSHELATGDARRRWRGHEAWD